MPHAVKTTEAFFRGQEKKQEAVHARFPLHDFTNQKKKALVVLESGVGSRAPPPPAYHIGSQESAAQCGLSRLSSKKDLSRLGRAAGARAAGAELGQRRVAGGGRPNGRRSQAMAVEPSA